MPEGCDEAAARAREGALMAACAAGDQAAAQQIIAQTAPRMLALARRLMRDAAEAEDVTQETMLRLWRIAPEWRAGEARVATWTHRVATNLCLDRLRKQGRMRAEPLDVAPEPEDPAPSALAGLAAAEQAALLEAALARLPDRQRLAVTLRHLEGWSNPAIAAAMSVGVEAVESLLGRGRRSLSRLLAKPADLAKPRPTSDSARKGEAP